MTWKLYGSNFSIRFFWTKTTLACLHAVSGWFHSIMTALFSCDGDDMVWKAKNNFSLILY